MCLLLGETLPVRILSQMSNHISFNEGLDNPNYDWNSLKPIDLINGRSRFFFDSMNLPRSFLQVDSMQWESNADYVHAERIIQNSLICINDGSERVISNSKYKLQRQRCRTETTFRQNILNLHVNPNM